MDSTVQAPGPSGRMEIPVQAEDMDDQEALERSLILNVQKKIREAGEGRSR